MVLQYFKTTQVASLPRILPFLEVDRSSFDEPILHLSLIALIAQYAF